MSGGVCMFLISAIYLGFSVYCTRIFEIRIPHISSLVKVFYVSLTPF